MSIFAQAKATAKPTTTDAKKAKTIVPVALGTKLSRLNEVRDEIKSLEAEEEMLAGDVKTVGKREFMRMYQESGRKPDSFILQSSQDGGKMMVIVQDKYTKVTEQKEELLKRMGCEDVIEETTEFSFNAELLAKHEAALSAAIESLDIPDEDKAKLIQAKVVKTIRKGTIEDLSKHKCMQNVFEVIDPVLQLKNS